jgi:hypothetical protein
MRIKSKPLNDNQMRWQHGCENCGDDCSYDHHQIWGIVDNKAIMKGYSCKRKPPVLEPGLYWVRIKSPTCKRLRDKYKLPDYYTYQWEWSGQWWHGRGWHGWETLTMKQFIEEGYQLGPRVVEPKGEEFKEVEI